MFKLNKITKTQLKDDPIIFSELTKRQMKICDEFNIKWESKHSY